MREVQHDEMHLWEKTSVVDHEAIDHERQIGDVVLASGDTVRVRVAQRIDFDLFADPVASDVSPPRITLGETFELTAVEAVALANHLYESADFVDRIVAETHRPSLVTEIRNRRVL